MLSEFGGINFMSKHWCDLLNPTLTIQKFCHSTTHIVDVAHDLHFFTHNNGGRGQQ